MNLIIWMVAIAIGMIAFVVINPLGLTTMTISSELQNAIKIRASECKATCESCGLTYSTYKIGSVNDVCVCREKELYTIPGVQPDHGEIGTIVHTDVRCVREHNVTNAYSSNGINYSVDENSLDAEIKKINDEYNLYK